MNYWLVARYGATFLAGVFAMWLWHDASMSRVETKEAKQETQEIQQVAVKTVTDAKGAQENTNDYLSKYNAAQSEVDKLRAQLRDGSVRLRVCQAESQTHGVQASNSRAVADEASADYARYREDVIGLIARGKEVDRWIDSCHAWVNR